MSRTCINELLVGGLIIIPSTYFIVCYLLNSQEDELENKFKIKMNKIIDQKNNEIRSLKIQHTNEVEQLSLQHANEVEQLSLQIIQERNLYEKKASMIARRTKVVISALIDAIEMRNRKLSLLEINE